MADLTFLTQSSNHFSEIVTSLSEKYKCNWDDVVHDSFQLYVSKMQESSKMIHSAANEANHILKDVDSFGIDTLEKQASGLYREALTI